MNPRLPSAIETAPAGELGTSTAPIPALIMSSLGDFRHQIAPGEEFEPDEIAALLWRHHSERGEFQTRLGIA